MYCVFWTDEVFSPDCSVHGDMTLAIAECAKRREEGFLFVTMAVADPNMVGKMGVSEVDENYDWHKRRDSISMRKKGLT